MKTKFLTLLSLLGMIGFAQTYQVPVYTATSLQPAEPGYEATKAIDNNINTNYHSQWYQNGIPDELTFYFLPQTVSIKKMVYTPSQTGTNGIWTNVSVYYSTQNNPNDFQLIQANINWPGNQQNQEINLVTPILNPYAVKFVVHSGIGDFSSCAELKFYSDDEVQTNDGIDCEIPTNELEINGQNDMKATILLNGSTASSYQSGEDISKSFDNNLSTIYHSSWSNTQFPVVLNYRLNGTTTVDYLKYIPRNDGGSNGNFGNVIIRYNTVGNSTFQDLMEFDFEQTGIPTTVHFPNQITPLNIQITVLDGSGGFASCAEMEFYKEVEGNSSIPIPTIFTDELCTELVAGTTQAQIDAVSSPFYKSLAQCIFDGTYVKKFRHQEYEVFQNIGSLSQEMKTGTYDPFENATGILFEANQKIALFVRNIPDASNVQLAIKDFSEEFDGPVSYFELKNGLNVFQTTNSGLAYISYFNNNLNLNDIEINIVSGKVNGYFDVNSSNSEWPELLSQTTYPMIDLRGEFVHLVYERAALKTGNPFKGLELLAEYDTIVRHERMLMGLFKYDRSPKNRQLTYSDHGGGWWAGGLGVHLDLDWGIDSVVNPDKLDKWGIPHEYGHINQIWPDLNWIGTTEVTNNIYSVWVNYHMNNENKPYSRLEEEVVSPTTGVQAMAGGKINNAIFDYSIQGEALQGSENYDVFKILVPFWQLELYYSLSGASRNAPILTFDYPDDYDGVDYANWYGIVAEVARNSNNDNLSNGEHLLNFVKNVCDAVQEDLSDFFIKTGFLKPINREIDDYGIGLLQITQAQIDETIAYIQSKNYSAPVSPVIHYISAHSIDIFKNQLPLSGQTGVGVSLNGQYLTIQHSEWQNAVAFETYNANNELIFASIRGSGNLSNQTSKVYFPTFAQKVYAVGFDGHRILVYPTGMANQEIDAQSDLKIYPNPIQNNQNLKIELQNVKGIYQLGLLNLEGRKLYSENGILAELESKLNQKLAKLKSGIYVLILKDTNGKTFEQKIIKK